MRSREKDMGGVGVADRHVRWDRRVHDHRARGSRCVGTSDANTPNAFAAPLEPAKHVNTRAWRTIAADPANHVDERVVLWGG